MVYPFVTVAVNIEDGAEGAGIVSFFGTLIGQAAKFPTDRGAIEIGLYKVLLHFLSNGLEQVTKVSDHRVNLEQGMFVLDKVMDTQNNQRPDNHPGPVNARPHNTGEEQYSA